MMRQKRLRAKTRKILKKEGVTKINLSEYSIGIYNLMIIFEDKMVNYKIIRK